MKEREKEKIALKEKEKEDHQHTTPAGAREGLPAVIDIHTPPTLEQLLVFASSRGYTNEKFIREWYDLMTNEFFWCHPVTGQPLNHWPAYFRACYLDLCSKRRKKSGASPRKADSWIATPADRNLDIF